MRKLLLVLTFIFGALSIAGLAFAFTLDGKEQSDSFMLGFTCCCIGGVLFLIWERTKPKGTIFKRN